MPAKVVLKVVANETTATNLLLNDQIQMVRIVGPDQRRLATMEDLHRQEVLAPLGLLWFNQKKGEPTTEEEVRRALVRALDLKQAGQVTPRRPRWTRPGGSRARTGCGPRTARGSRSRSTTGRASGRP
ncbi:MAG: hypothetical protein GEV11_11685 [Streptosporangiales bacterium]|nr:hypothetical protein [Streptosporangiales bacterium]